jgi:hypothetical protein
MLPDTWQRRWSWTIEDITRWPIAGLVTAHQPTRLGGASPERDFAVGFFMEHMDRLPQLSLVHQFSQECLSSPSSYPQGGSNVSS